jgi:hypothetical protein
MVFRKMFSVMIGTTSRWDWEYITPVKEMVYVYASARFETLSGRRRGDCCDIVMIVLTYNDMYEISRDVFGDYCHSINNIIRLDLLKMCWVEGSGAICNKPSFPCRCLVSACCHLIHNTAPPKCSTVPRLP